MQTRLKCIFGIYVQEFIQFVLREPATKDLTATECLQGTMKVWGSDEACKSSELVGADTSWYWGEAEGLSAQECVGELYLQEIVQVIVFKRVNEVPTMEGEGSWSNSAFGMGALFDRFRRALGGLSADGIRRPYFNKH